MPGSSGVTKFIIVTDIILVAFSFATLSDWDVQRTNLFKSSQILGIKSRNNQLKKQSQGWLWPFVSWLLFQTSFKLWRSLAIRQF